MSRLIRAAVLVATLAVPAFAQQDLRAKCVAPDTIMVLGTKRTSPTAMAILSGITAGDTLMGNSRLVRAISNLYGTGDFDTVTVTCDPQRAGKAAIVFQVHERPTLASITVVGPHALSQSTVEDRVELLLRRAVDPALVQRGVTRIDSLYQKNGYYLARIVPETTVVDSSSIAITYRIDEGKRLAIAGLNVVGAKGVSPDEVAGAMRVRPEGFFWFRKGEFDVEKYTGDLGERLPALYAERGFIDFQLLSDTLIVDRDRAKGVIELTVSEGQKYRVGNFTMAGNQHFDEEYIRRFYPFGEDFAGPSLTQRALGLIRGRAREKGVFDQAAWDTAAQKVTEAYANDGYIYARVVPEMLRGMRADTPVVNLHLSIVEGTPAIINRVDVSGNDYTTEHCIRDVIELVPGHVFSRSALIRSWQNINNLGFFEPLEGPDVTQANEQGDQNITFKVKEKRTGTINFGASMGQGVGVGGFFSVEQPNVFGRCKRASLGWQFGRYINDFNLSYTDPSIKRTRYSGTLNAYRSQARYQIADLGQTTRTGGTLRVGFPIRGAMYTRAFTSYTGESVRYGNSGLLGTINCDGSCFRSAVGLDITRDTRFGLPFPIGGALQSLTASFNGGPLGGSANFQKYTGESRAYVPIKQWGGEKSGQPVVLALGLSTRAGAVFGNTGPFFFSQRFALGGVQFGEPLRGYPEFSITPTGFLTGTSTYNAQRESFGSAFFANTVELGLRFNSMVYTNIFYDAGNVWERPREFDPTRLFRGTGIGLSTVTPLGPLGLDWAYGFDRLDVNGRRKPQWQLHFRLGQLF